jgi:Domain of unknown function (DUF3291)
MAPSYHLAQVNIALPSEPLTSSRLADFVALLAPVNELADRSPGFIWRLQTDDGDATSVRAFGDERLIVNMSVWRTLGELADFVYSGLHAAVMRRRREWFEQITDIYQAAWWIPADSVPSIAEAETRLEHLRQYGPTAHAFPLRRPFAPPGRSDVPASSEGWMCRA